ncbi:MAG: hypothetical protein EOP54_11215 [Sphingobacteriales bacterium]|nr:MAG: hypothetical protein EOP54_11215 [Sphingobacteriales bacterium]
MYTIKSALSFAFLALVLSSCGNQTEEQEKKAWTAPQKKEFKDNCFTSTRFSFEQMGKHLDSARISTICDCTAFEIESQYNYDAASRIPKAKIQAILGAALQKCAPDMMDAPDTDSLAPKR